MIHHKPVFAAIIKKPFSALSDQEIHFFLTYKESQYAIRRQRIENYCSLKDENFGRKILKNSLIFDSGKLQSLDNLDKSNTWHSLEDLTSQKFFFS